MATGKVKFFNNQKGFGFIIDDETQEEIFVHFSGLVDRHLNEGDEVIFDIESENDGKRQHASNVKKKS
jgi:CspA family cold shock protein